MLSNTRACHPHDSHGRLDPIGKTGISITASSSLAFTRHWPRATDHWPHFSRPAPQTTGREFGLFSCSIPPWFVLSNNLSTTNTRAIWLCFGAFLSPPASSAQFHWPRYWLLTTILPSHAPRRNQRGQVVRRPSSTGYCLTPTADLSNTERGPISTNDHSIIQYITEPGDSHGEINPLFLACRRRTLDHSLVAGGGQRQSLQACLPDGHTAQCLFSAGSP